MAPQCPTSASATAPLATGVGAPPAVADASRAGRAVGLAVPREDGGPGELVAVDGGVLVGFGEEVPVCPICPVCGAVAVAAARAAAAASTVSAGLAVSVSSEA